MSSVQVEVLTRRGETVADDFNYQAGPINSGLWKAFDEKQRQLILVAILDSRSVDDSVDTTSENFKPSAIARYRAFRDCLYRLHSTVGGAKKDYFLSIGTRATGETSTHVSEHAALIRRVSHYLNDNFQSSRSLEWNDEKNKRRCMLVDKEIEGTISVDEQTELRQLQKEMLAYRRKVAPLPLEDLRELHRELLQRASGQKNAK